MDLRSDHMKAEQAATEALAALPFTTQTVMLLELLMAELAHNAAHNAPVSISHLARLEEALALARQADKAGTRGTQAKAG